MAGVQQGEWLVNVLRDTLCRGDTQAGSGRGRRNQACTEQKEDYSRQKQYMLGSQLLLECSRN